MSRRTVLALIFASLSTAAVCSRSHAADPPPMEVIDVRPVAYEAMYYAESNVKRDFLAVYLPVELPEGHVFLHVIADIHIEWPTPENNFLRLACAEYKVSDGQNSYTAIGHLGKPWGAMYRNHETFFSQPREIELGLSSTRQDLIFIVPASSENLRLSVHGAEKEFVLPPVSEPEYHKILNFDSVSAEAVDAVAISPNAGGGTYKNSDPKGRVALVKCDWSFVPTPEIEKTEKFQALQHEWLNVRYQGGSSPNIGAVNTSNGELFRAYTDRGNSTNTSGRMPKTGPGWKPYVHKGKVFAFPIPAGVDQLQLTLTGHPVGPVIKIE